MVNKQSGEQPKVIEETVINDNIIDAAKDVADNHSEIIEDQNFSP